MTQSLKKLVFGAAVVSLVSLVAVQPAGAVQIITFGQTSGTNTVTATAAGGSTTIIGTNISVNITQMENSVGNVAAFLTFSLSSNGAATDDGVTTAQGFNGSFSIFNGGTEYLGGTFTNAALSGFTGGTGATLFTTNPPAFTNLVFTENGPITTTGNPIAFSLSFSNLLPVFAVSGNTIDSFTASVSGLASASTIPNDNVPEPGSMMLLGSGLMGLAASVRRRLKAKR